VQSKAGAIFLTKEGGGGGKKRGGGGGKAEELAAKPEMTRHWH